MLLLVAMYRRVVLPAERHQVGEQLAPKPVVSVMVQFHLHCPAEALLWSFARAVLVTLGQPFR